MRAVDTNIVVRFLLGDDERQAAAARQVLANPCLLPLTVLLETVWVLNSRFELARADVARLLRHFVDLETVHCDNLSMLHWSLERYQNGADIADMLHLVEAREATHFTTFDRRLAKAAGINSPVTVETLR